MAVQFHPLPLNVFPEDAQPYIARLNAELRDLFGLEGSLANPDTTKRSDSTIARKSGTNVDVTRVANITVVGGTVTGGTNPIGAPNLTFTTSNAIGSTTTVVSINSSIALFGTQLPVDIALSPVLGTSGYAARADHTHGFSISNQLPTTTKGDLIVYDGSNNVRQGIGTNDYTLTADSSQTNGLAWTLPRHRLLACYTTSSTISNDMTPSNFTGEAIGIAANTFDTAGQHARWKYRGVVGTSNVATTLNIELIYGTSVVVVVTTDATLFAASLSNNSWEMNADVTCKVPGAGGTIEAQGYFQYSSGAKITATWEMPNAACLSYNTTADQTWRMRVTWGTTATENAITLRQRTIEFMDAP